MGLPTGRLATVSIVVTVALVAVVCAAIVAIAFAINPPVQRTDAYRALGATDRANDRVRLANAEAEGDPPDGFTPGPRVHKPGTLATLQYQSYDADGQPLDTWQVRALVPAVPETDRREGAFESNSCPRECQAEISRGAVRVIRSGEPGIAAEWVLRMPLNHTFDLGRRTLTTQDLLDDRPRRINIRFTKRDGVDVAEPSRITLTLLAVCDARVQLGSVSHLEFFPDAIVPIPRGFRTDRWLLMEGCGPLTRFARAPEPPPPPRAAAPQPPPDIRAIALRRATGTGHMTLQVDESWFARRPAAIEFVLRDVCRYDQSTDRWSRVTMPHEGVGARIAARAAADAGERVAVRLPQETALFWIRWLEREAGDRSARNQSFHDTLATSGPILCQDIDLGAAPAGRVPACVPFADKAQARFVPDPHEACVR
ncbi:MAG TPA: hypothetical protein VGY57_13370 [Vicinamibacterales bacterium]|nr:hypothetical protein [Vicinamibacterales bacterium]